MQRLHREKGVVVVQERLEFSCVEDKGLQVFRELAREGGRKGKANGKVKWQPIR